MLTLRRCPVCDRAAPSLCARCRDGFTVAPERSIPPAASVRSLYLYDAAVAAAIVQAKQPAGRHLWRGFGRELAGVVEDEPDLITWVPADPGHRRVRGFDQGRLLARSLAAACAVPVRSTLRRSSGTQHGRSGRERRAGSIVAPSRRIRGRILLVDDVVTTGRSVERAAQVLLGAGAESVRVVTVASVPCGRP